MGHLSNDHEDYPNQHVNKHEPCSEIGHFFLDDWKVNGN